MKTEKITEINSDDDIKKLEKQHKESLKTKSAVKQSVIDMLSGKPSREDKFFKSLSMRLLPVEFAQLSVLASRLNQSTSGLAKILLVGAVSDATSAYLSVKELEDEFAGETFAQDVGEEEQRIIEELI